MSGYLYFFGFIGLATYLVYYRYRTEIKTIYTIGESFVNRPQPKVLLVINDINQTVVLKYTYYDKEYKITMPYRRCEVLNMSQYTAELSVDDLMIDITQQPGIPYILSAKELGGKFIKLTNFITGESHIYGLNEAPLYGKELAFED